MGIQDVRDYRDIDELIRQLSLLGKVEATKRLTEYYANARFRPTYEDFCKQYTDGSNDGGIDFYQKEELTFFVLQSKFTENPRRVSKSEILDEIRKIKNTLTTENPNREADDFVNSLRRDKGNKNAILEIVWLTTDIVEQSLEVEIDAHLKAWRKENGWDMDIDFTPIDKYGLDRVIYDVNHGYVPYTGKKEIGVEKGQWMETTYGETGVRSLVCSVNVNDLMGWFKDSGDVDKFLQKNVREFLGESSRINREIQASYLTAPDWFWYKHNGIIIFADNLHVDEGGTNLILRNPQVVNGGQTLKSLFTAYDRNNRADNPARVTLRIYRLPYEHTESYKRCIDIISALNSQNKINSSDLRSTDPRQVRLERLFERIGSGYKYMRKRSKDAVASRYNVKMRDLAMLYYVCKKNAPHEGVRGNLERLFEEEGKYSEVFDEKAINRDFPSGSHVILNYATCWSIDRILNKQKSQIPRRDAEYSVYTRWFVLTDIYTKLLDWKRRKFNIGWQTWVNFIESPEFERAIFDYGIRAFRVGREIIPAKEEARSFFKTAEAARKFQSRVSKRKFEIVMNKALLRFKKENELD